MHVLSSTSFSCLSNIYNIIKFHTRIPARSQK